MTLRYLRGYEPGEIAGELGIEPNAVYQLLHNGHKKLRETWSDG
jgi:DNA-directed RNA polymerase specialized sigma24 family protein